MGLDVDVAIVGGGPAGISTALFLTNIAPHLRDRIVVLEKAKYPREKICAGAIGARADRLLASIGVRVDVPSVPVRGLFVRAGDHALEVKRAETIGRVVRRVEFDHALANEARSRGIRVLDGVKVTGFSIDEARGVRIETSMGLLAARVLVGADGVGSFVRRTLGLPRGSFMAKAVEVDTPHVSSDAARDVLGFDLSEQGLPGYAWDFPTIVGGAPLACRGIYELSAEGVPEREASEPDPADRLIGRTEKLGVPAPASSLKRFAERGLSFHEPFARPRVLLVGEAAGIDPALGEGIAQAIQYGAASGPYLQRALATNDLAFASFPSALRESRLGLDLLVRARAARLVYGQPRPVLERWVTRSRALSIAGMSYFAGDRVDRLALARAALDLGRAAMSYPLTWLRSAASR